MALETQAFYEFGPFRLNAVERQLTRDGEVVALTPKVYDLLLVLVKNCGRMVDKEELMGALWPDTFVEEGNLTQNVSTLRKALGENTNGHRYIETIPKHGYRFVADVSAVSENGASDNGKIEVIPPPLPLDQPRTLSWMTKSVILAFGLVLVGLAIGANMIRKPRPTDTSARTFGRTVMPKPPTENHDARMLYLKGIDASKNEQWSEAVAYFTQAVAKDDKFAAAYAALSVAYIEQSNEGNEKPIHALKKADWAARKALEMDENLVEAHKALGWVMMIKDRDWSGARKHFDWAISINPQSAEAHRLMAFLLQTTGQLDDAIKERLVAFSFRMDDLRLRSELACTLKLANSLNEAKDLLLSILAAEPRYNFARLHLGQVYLQQGNWGFAIKEFKKCKRDDATVAHLSYAYARKGNLEKGKGYLKVLLDKSASGKYVSAFYIAIAYAGLNKKDQAFEYLNRAFDDRTSNMGVKVNPVFNDLHQDPRFNELLRRAGLDK